MQPVAILITLARRGLLGPGRPDRVARQLDAFRRWGLTLYGELFSAAARSPTTIAVRDDDRSLTYAELADRVVRLATALRDRHGIGPGQPVGLLCRNSAAMLEALYAIGVTGADVVLLNTGMGAIQLDRVLAEQRVITVVHDDEFGPLLPTSGVVGISADGAADRPDPTVAGLIAGTVAGHRGTPVQPPATPGRTIVLTSGTTGSPKGARRPVPGGFGPLASMLSRVPLRAQDRVFVPAPLFHTWGYAGVQLTVALRGTAVLCRRFQPEQALQAIAAHRCTAVFVVPVMLERLLEVPASARPATPDLRVVASAGSALPGNLTTRFMDAFGDVLYNLYGSTEASWASIATPQELRTEPTCAGRPPAGTIVSIVDADGRPVPPGQVGRILVGNDMLFEGYTDRAGAEPVARPRSPQALVDTGDLGRMSAEGLLHVDGRADDMIISGGENIHPGAVEHVLAELPEVREVAVVGVPDAEYGQRLAAWVVLYPGAALDADGVRGHVRTALSRFSVPRDVHFVSCLPRNATGKVVPRDLPR